MNKNEETSKNEAKNKPTRSFKLKKQNEGGNKNPFEGVGKVRIVKLTMQNILIGMGVVLVALLLLNSLMQPSLGKQVTIDEFLQKITNDEIARVDIRSDGNAVGYGKYVEVSKLLSNENFEVDKNNSTQFNKESDLEAKKINDLVQLYKKPANLWEELAQTAKSLDPNNYPKEIYVLRNEVLVDWANKDTKDWILNDVNEQQLREALQSNNLDITTLPTTVNFIRAAGASKDVNMVEEGLKNERYSQIWRVGDTVYARVKSSEQFQGYVNFGGVTDDFTKFLNQEGYNLNTGTVEYRVLPINQIDLVTVFNIIFIGTLAFLGFMLLRSINSQNGGLMKFGQSKARMFFGQKINVSFKDVAGVDEAKEELKEVVDFLKNPKKYQRLGAKIPRGLLMVGSPGTGKTLLARAIAGEAGVPFFHTSGSEFEEMLVGAGASRVRDLFDKAKKAAPSLIFIDEIDAVGRKRGTTIQSSSTEQTLNQILVEMDGFEIRDNVIVIAATNRPDVLDPALLRPGRFDRKVVLDLPDIVGRIAILKIHAQNKPISKLVDFEKVARRTVGFSGADLENMLNEAAIIVAKDGRDEITPHDIEEAATKVQTGPIRKRRRDAKELKMTAYHEAAHAIVMYETPESDPVHRITILSRGMALGYTMPLPENDQLQMTMTKMESKIRSLLAGYSAEEMIFGDVTTGASNDIEKATGIAKRMVQEFGMSKKLGLVKYGNVEDEPHVGWAGPDRGFSEDSAKMIDEEVRRIIMEAYQAAKDILDKNRGKLDAISELLLQEEVIEGDTFKKMMRGEKLDASDRGGNGSKDLETNAESDSDNSDTAKTNETGGDVVDGGGVM
jgi:cell division protease FtsH